MLNQNSSNSESLVLRKGLQFPFEGVPKYWFDGDPFKTRFFDALGLAFPEGERFFIQSIRVFRDEVIDIKLQNDITTFFKQEALHAVEHTELNERLELQGLPIKKILKLIRHALDHNLKNKPREYNLAVTVAFEHLTSIMAESFFSRKKTFENADPYVRALWAWHTIEEMEHRDVAFEVMKQVGNVDEFTRKVAFIQTMFMVLYFTFVRTNTFLRYDGYSKWQRIGLMTKGFSWVFGPKGFMTSNIPLVVDGFKKDFHPSDHPIIAQYDVWVKALKESGDPIYAGNKFWEAGR